VLVVVVPEHAVSGADGGLSWTIFGGVPPYEQTLNGEPVTGTSMSGLSAGNYDMVVTDSNGCSVTVGIELLLGVGLDELNAGTIGLYPNPAIDHLRIASQAVWSSWRIMDTDGRILLTGSRPNNGYIDVSPLKSGAYLLELMEAAGGQASLRFMKN
jgi:Secretion system C-terminal sorting domain